MAAHKDGTLSILTACFPMGPWLESSHPSVVMATATALLILRAMAARKLLFRFVVAALHVKLYHLFDQFIVSAVADSVLQYVLSPTHLQSISTSLSATSASKFKTNIDFPSIQIWSFCETNINWTAAFTSSFSDSIFSCNVRTFTIPARTWLNPCTVSTGQATNHHFWLA